MNQNRPFVLEMAFHLVSLHRAGESAKALWLRRQPQSMTIDDDQLQAALLTVSRLPDQSPRALEDWVCGAYLEDGLAKGYASVGDAGSLRVLAAKAHTHYRDLRSAS